MILLSVAARHAVPVPCRGIGRVIHRLCLIVIPAKAGIHLVAGFDLKNDSHVYPKAKND